MSGFGRGYGFLLPAAGGLVVAADWLFYRHALGWTAGLYAALLTVVLMLRPPRRAASPWPRRVLAVLSLGLALALVEEPTWLALCMSFVAVGSVAMTTRDGWTDSVAEWAARWAHFVAAGWARVATDWRAEAYWFRRHPLATPGPLQAVRLWVVPVLLGGVFVLIFSLANPIIEQWRSATFAFSWRWASKLPDLLEISRVLFWVAVATVVWALLRVRSGRLTGRGPALPPPLIAVEPFFSPAFVARCLLVFNVVFAAQTLLDVTYLWGGRTPPVGMTYKEYAHRGAYPLIAAALLAALFVLVTFRAGSQTPAWRRPRALVYAWVGQTVLLTFSAGWRLFLLVQDTNLTRLRLATTIWLGLVVAGLLLIVWRIFASRDNTWLLRANVLATAGVLYACCFLDLDGFIATFNARRCEDVARRGHKMGLTYIRDLGVESIPALDELSVTLSDPASRAFAKQQADGLRVKLAESTSEWRGWTWRRHRLLDGHGGRADGAVAKVDSAPATKSAPVVR